MTLSEVANRGLAKPPKCVGCMRTGDDGLPSSAACTSHRSWFLVTVEGLTVRLLLSAAVRFGPAGLFRADEVKACLCLWTSTPGVSSTGETRDSGITLRYCHLELTMQRGVQCSV